MRLGWVAGAFGIAAWLGLAVDARACSCTPGWSLLAPFDAEHPSGAAIVFTSGCGGSFDVWSVTVDGEPAGLATPAIVGEIATAKISPAPAEGAEVVLLFDCGQGVEDIACADSDAVIERARFTIVAPDLISPPEALSVVMEPIEHDDTGCFTAAGLQAIDVQVELGAREPGSWISLELARSDQLPVTHTRVALPQDGALATVLMVNEGLLDFPEVCLDAVVHDAAGNESPAEQDCIVAHDTAASLSPLRRCGVAPTTEWSGALLGLLVLILRRRAITGRTA